MNNLCIFGFSSAPDFVFLTEPNMRRSRATVSIRQPKKSERWGRDGSEMDRLFISKSLVTIYNTTLCQVVRSHLHFYLISREKTNTIHAHFPRKMAENFKPVFQTNSEICGGKKFKNLTINLQKIFRSVG